MRKLRSRLWILGAAASLVLTGSLALTTATPAAASPPAITVHCPGDLQGAINNAAPGSTLVVDGTCVGNFYIWKDLTVVGPATLDGNGAGLTLSVTGTVVLNDLTIENGNGFGGGLWNQGSLTMNRSIVTNNTGGGVLNGGQLTMSQSTVSNNTGDYASGISNCGPTSFPPPYQSLCPTPASLVLNSSTVSGNVVTLGSGGGIFNSDSQGVVTLNSSTVSGNTAGTNGGGIANNGTATLNNSTVSDNHSNGGPNTWSGGGGISNTGPTTLNNSIVRDNTAAWLGGGIYASGPMTINKSRVTGNSAGPVGGGLVTWDGPTRINSSEFSNNSDQNGFDGDNPTGVYVATNPLWLLYFPNINPSFTANTQSTFS
jgi:hypothetical protein